VVWIWIGGLIMTIGTVVAAWPTLQERHVAATDPAALRGAERA
jgi:cytochrome c biogenesis factor